MCTLTFIARQNGYALGMNRDETLTRSTAVAPAQDRTNSRLTLAPSEVNGGTWMGANDATASFALINWYGAPARVEKGPISRGQVLRSILHLDCPTAVTEALAVLPTRRVNPFRLIGVFPRDRVLVEWRWNVVRLERIEHSWKTNIWISSGLDEPGAQQTRGKTFREALREPAAGSLAWLRRLHCSHGPECGPYSICMHRREAATVSYTEIVASRNWLAMTYVPGPPCCTELLMAAVPSQKVPFLSRTGIASLSGCAMSVG